MDLLLELRLHYCKHIAKLHYLLDVQTIRAHKTSKRGLILLGFINEQFLTRFRTWRTCIQSPKRVHKATDGSTKMHIRGQHTSINRWQTRTLATEIHTMYHHCHHWNTKALLDVVSAKCARANTYAHTNTTTCAYLLFLLQIILCENCTITRILHYVSLEYCT